MKALLIAIACVAAAVGGLTACGGSADGESGAAQAQPTAPTPTPPTAAAQAQPTATSTAVAQAQPTAAATAIATAQVEPTATAAAADATATPSATPESLRAPEFSLPSAYGGTVSLSGLLDGKEGAALVFYRGFF